MTPHISLIVTGSQAMIRNKDLNTNIVSLPIPTPNMVRQMLDSIYYEKGVMTYIPISVELLAMPKYNQYHHNNASFDPGETKQLHPRLLVDPMWRITADIEILDKSHAKTISEYRGLFHRKLKDPRSFFYLGKRQYGSLAFYAKDNPDIGPVDYNQPCVPLTNIHRKWVDGKVSVIYRDIINGVCTYECMED